MVLREVQTLGREIRSDQHGMEVDLPQGQIQRTETAAARQDQAIEPVATYWYILRYGWSCYSLEYESERSRNYSR